MTRDDREAQLDQTLMDLRHAKAALDTAQNRSDVEYASAQVDNLIRRVAGLRHDLRKVY